MTEWKAVGHIEEIPVRGARVVDTPWGEIAVFRTRDNKVFALRDKCPHKGGALSQGIVHGHAVTCPLHNWVISLEDGEAQGYDTGCTRTYVVRVDEQGTVFLSLDSVRHCA
ncbi:nitrite reductase small subunit NirD [Hahella sp. SMD15-11]|uniref:Nitrite reductase small subunit NirD n=1 Tax=Thermohahella caldifontis TaxID=3142973 RepID=A0AB39USQ5_9GAMM